jgi:hypothetical protein
VNGQDTSWVPKPRERISVKMGRRLAGPRNHLDCCRKENNLCPLWVVEPQTFQHYGNEYIKRGILFERI